MNQAGVQTGDEVPSFTDPKRVAWILGGIWTFMLPVAVIGLFKVLGEAPWALLALPLIVFAIVPVIDAIVGRDTSNPPEESVPGLTADPYYMWVARTLVMVGYGSITCSVIFLTLTPLPWWAFAAFLIASGIVNGTLINLAHELGHKTNDTDRLFSKIALGAVGYGHFCAEHNLGHHKNVATPEDCASARMGESVYRFALREIPGAFIGGWKIEANRLRKRGLKVWSADNQILQANAITVAGAVVLTALFGWKLLPILIAHHFLSWYALTMVNYIEHYGLLRQKLPNGRYEPTQPHHSWNTNYLVSNVMQLHLQRHSDHHTYPMRPYQALRDYEDVPHLPSGYPGCMTLAAIPPLWFKIMDPKVMRWAEGDLSRAHLHAPAQAKLERQWGGQ